MNERWGYQLATGVAWTLFMDICITTNKMYDCPILDQIMKLDFWINTLIYLVIGVFIIGYINWYFNIKRKKSKKE
jgi:hypothetical protein